MSMSLFGCESEFFRLRTEDDDDLVVVVVFFFFFLLGSDDLLFSFTLELEVLVTLAVEGVMAPEVVEATVDADPGMLAAMVRGLVTVEGGCAVTG